MAQEEGAPGGGEGKGIGSSSPSSSWSGWLDLPSEVWQLIFERCTADAARPTATNGPGSLSVAKQRALLSGGEKLAKLLANNTNNANNANTNQGLNAFLSALEKAKEDLQETTPEFIGRDFDVAALWRYRGVCSHWKALIEDEGWWHRIFMESNYTCNFIPRGTLEGSAPRTCSWRTLVRVGVICHTRGGFRQCLDWAISSRAYDIIIALADLDSSFSIAALPKAFLHDACSRCDSALVQALLYAGADARKSNALGTPLHALCWQGANATEAIKIIDVLVEAGADVESRDTPDLGTPLHLAVRNKNIPVALVSALLAKGARPNSVAPGQTGTQGSSLHDALMDACDNGAVAEDDVIKVCDMLLEAGSSVDCTISHKTQAETLVETPLWRAIRHRRARLVERLVAVGKVDVNARVNNSSLLIHACSCEAVEIVEMLLKMNANVNFADGRNKNTALHHILGLRTDMSPERMKIIEMLLDAGADPNVPNRIGEQPINLLWSGHTMTDKDGSLNSWRKLVKRMKPDALPDEETEDGSAAKESKWVCESCDTANAESNRACELCWTVKPWKCSKCSTLNTKTIEQCKKCQHPYSPTTQSTASEDGTVRLTIMMTDGYKHFHRFSPDTTLATIANEFMKWRSPFPVILKLAPTTGSIPEGLKSRMASSSSSSEITSSSNGHRFLRMLHQDGKTRETCVGCLGSVFFCTNVECKGHNFINQSAGAHPTASSAGWSPIAPESLSDRSVWDTITSHHRSSARAITTHIASSV